MSQTDKTINENDFQTHHVACLGYYYFFVIAALPVDLFGCRNRGLIAALIANAGGLAGVVAAVRAVIDKACGEKDSHLWVTSALIFAVPAIFIVLTEI